MIHTHYWVNQHIPHSLVWLNQKWLYKCSVCDKEKYFKFQPVNPTAPSEWELYEMSDKRYTMSPPLFANDSDEAAGERYKRYITHKEKEMRV